MISWETGMGGMYGLQGAWRAFGLIALKNERFFNDSCALGARVMRWLKRPL